MKDRTPKARKTKKPGLAKVSPVFKAPANPATWRPTPRQMEIYLNICHGTQVWREAARLKTTTTQLQAMCRQIDEFLLEQSIGDVRLMRTRMEVKLENIYCMAMQSFELSKNPAKTVETGTTATGEYSKERTTEQAAGNPSWLGIARDVLESLKELWAMNKKTGDEGGDAEAGRIGGVPRIAAMEMMVARLSLKIKQAKGG